MEVWCIVILVPLIFKDWRISTT